MYLPGMLHLGGLSEFFLLNMIFLGEIQMLHTDSVNRYEDYKILSEWFTHIVITGVHKFAFSPKDNSIQ